MNFNLSIVTLGVKNLAQSIKFYREGLGLQLSSASQEEIAFFNLGGIVLALYPYEKLAEDAQVKPDGKGFSGITLAYNAKSEKAVDETFKVVEKLGATITKSPQKVFWGGYSGYFSDLDGYLWEIAYNPFFEFDANGNLKI